MGEGSARAQLQRHLPVALALAVLAAVAGRAWMPRPAQDSLIQEAESPHFTAGHHLQPDGARRGVAGSFSRTEIGDGGWSLDPDANSLIYSGCDLDVVEAGRGDLAELIENEYINMGKPVLIRGLANSWPARSEERWSRPNLLHNYGDLSTNVSPGAGIVYAGGGQMKGTTLASQLEGMRVVAEAADHLSATDVSFDVEFFRRFPALMADFSPPRIFHSFFSKSSLQSGLSWLILSLGGSRSGLPFHVHGKTWLGVVFGAKRWFLYEPGRSPPDDVGAHPLISTHVWFNDVLPRLEGSGLPLQCTQNAGDVMFLPENWKHATLNVGETIAVGGQMVYEASKRRADCEEVLAKSPDDVEALHGLGVALAHLGMMLLQSSESGADKSSLSLAEKHLEDSVAALRRAIELRPGQPELYMLLGEVYMEMGRDHDAIAVGKMLVREFNCDNVPAGVAGASLAAVQFTIAKYLNSVELAYEAEKLLLLLKQSQQPYQELLLELAIAFEKQGKWGPLKDILHDLEAMPLTDLSKKYVTYFKQLVAHVALQQEAD